MIKIITQKAQKAQTIYSTFSQTQVDFIFKKAAFDAYNNARYLAKMAVEETNMGIIEDKVYKNTFASRILYNYFKKEPTCDVIYDNRITGIRKIAYPMGIIAGIIPCTNPTSTAIYKALLALKTRNALIVSPHPRAINCTKEAINIVNAAAVSAGAPEGLLSSLDVATIQSSKELMQDKNISLILATGGPAMVTSAYSSGHPSIGVGSGNTPVIIDETVNVFQAVFDIIKSKSFDHGVLCPSEQCVYIVDPIYNYVITEFKKQYGYITTLEETDKLRKIILKEGKLNADIVGQSPQKLAKMAGFTVPNITKIILCEISDKPGKDEPLSHEKLCPILAVYRVPNFSEAVKLAKKQVEFSGMGHTATLHTHPDNIANIREFQEAIPVCRLLINQPSVQGALGYTYNRNWPVSLMMGCGTWGGTSYSGNIVPSLLLNIKTVIDRTTNY